MAEYTPNDACAASNLTCSSGAPPTLTSMGAIMSNTTSTPYASGTDSSGSLPTPTCSKCFHDLQILDCKDMAWLDVMHSDDNQQWGNNTNNSTNNGTPHVLASSVSHTSSCHRQKVSLSSLVYNFTIKRCASLQFYIFLYISM
jgi:hypothetical protein